MAAPSATLGAPTASRRLFRATTAAVFLLSLGESSWRRFLPTYLLALGAPVAAIGLHGSAQDLLDGLYQYPGGWLADRFGRRRTILCCLALAAAGYATYAWASWWPAAFAALALV